MIDRDAMKRDAAEAAIALVQPGMVVGLGSGSTATFVIEGLIRRVRQGLDIVAIPTSERSAAQAREGGIRLVDFDTHRRLDLTIDGADEIVPGTLDLVKGLGGALLREKIVASASDRLVIVADESKLVERLGSRSHVPIEVVSFGWQTTADRIVRIGGAPKLRRGPDGTPFRTDGGNLILDCGFAPNIEPAALEQALAQIVGLVETGLFVGMAEQALVARPNGVVRFTRTG